jgi:hypothetical protein
MTKHGSGFPVLAVSIAPNRYSVVAWGINSEKWANESIGTKSMLSAVSGLSLDGLGRFRSVESHYSTLVTHWEP